MCGIVYAHDFTGYPVNNGVMQMFDDQRHRGLQGFGLFDGQEMNMVHATNEDKILKWLVKYDSNLLMFHHRNPTSTINVKKAAHPFSTKKYFGDNQYILVHNGIISNSHNLVDDHEEIGINYQSELPDGSFNDSESLLWDVALYLEGKQDKLKACGMIAFVCMRLHKGKLDRLYFGRNSSAPLNLYRDKKGLALSSEGPGESIKEDTLYNWNYDLKRLTTKTLVIPKWTTVHTYTGEYARSDWEDDNYEAWGRAGSLGYLTNDDPIPAKSWVSDAVRRKFNLSKVKTFNEQQRLTLPSTASYSDGNYETYDDEWEEEVELMLDKPNHAEIEGRVLGFLMRNDGNFEKSYQEAEDAYDQIMEDNEAMEEERHEVLLLEGVLQWFMADPEWTSEKSVSSLWEALWDNSQLANKT